MGTLGTRAHNGKKPGARRIEREARPHPAVAKLAVALRDYKEAAEQQAATAEILRAMSQSPGDALPVFEAIVDKAHRLCDAAYSVLYRYDGKLIHLAAAKDVNKKAMDAVRGRYPQEPDRHKIVGRAILDRKVFHTADIGKDRRFPAAGRIILRRAVVSVPLLHNGTVLGVISCGRAESKAFTKKEISLLKTFADQAVIAIENTRLFNETREALERQTATSEILSVIASSRSDVQPVLEAVGRNAARLCEANNAVIFRLEGDLLQQVASYGGIPTSSHPSAGLPVDRSRVTGRAVVDRRTIHVHDLAAETKRYPEGSRDARRDGHRTTLATPLMREGAPIGAILIRRMEVRPFSDTQIALLTTFADQAVIAIENVRLFNELKTTNSSLREALDHQTATAEILKVISASPTDVQPVFDTIVRNAARLGNAAVGFLISYDGATMRLAAQYNVDPEEEAIYRPAFPRPAARDTMTGRSILDRAVINLADIQSSDFGQGTKERARRAGYRSALVVPMLRGGVPIGSLNIQRREAGAFPGAYVALLKTFADQAVIAIENVRLFNETKESLEQQTAISEVLRVISGSPVDVQPVLDAVAVRAARICDASDARIFLVDGGALRHVAGSGDVPVAVKLGDTVPLTRDSVVGRALIDRAPVHIEDFNALPAEEFPVARKMQAGSGWRTNLSVPLLREDRALGAIVLRRIQVRPFTGKQIELVKTFADQAAIAIENVRLFNETKQALERQTATAEILGVISSTPTDVQPVFDVIVKSALRLLEGHSAAVTRIEGDLEHLGAYTSTIPSGDERLRSMYPRPPSQGGGAGARAIATGKPSMIADYESDPTVSERVRETARLRGLRSGLVVPMLREGTVIGTIRVTRAVTGPFPDHQIRLLQTFADQAVIAIENVRLFNETKEALERQTATADVLKVISKSPADLQPVLDAVAQRAARLSGVRHSSVFLAHGDRLRRVAVSGVTSGSEELPIRRTLVNGRAFVERRTVHVPDIVPLLDSEYPDAREQQRQIGFRSLLVVPMLRGGEAIGTVVVHRPEARPFSNEEIGLLETFADQAVIAIENTRLFNETKEALERQTATSEILRVISSSPTDVQPVFRAILENATRLCGAHLGFLSLYDGEKWQTVAHLGANREFAEWIVGRGRFTPSPGSGLDQMLAVRMPVHIADYRETSSYRERYPMSVKLVELGGVRSYLAVPMLKDGQIVGGISVYRAEVRTFEQKQIDLLSTFADQAVIAIENVRLFNETKEALEQQTAMGEVLEVISKSHSDLAPVFDAILASATRLCDAHLALLSLYDGECYRTVAQRGANPEFWRYVLERGAFKPDPLTHLARIIEERKPIHVLDMKEAVPYRKGVVHAVKFVELAGARSYLLVPLMKDDHFLGTIAIYRPEVRAFTEKQIELVRTYARQAVIAIENVRLFNETKEALERQTATAEILKVIAGSPSDVQPVFDAIAASARQLIGGLTATVVRVLGDDIHLAAFTTMSRPADESLRILYPAPVSGQLASARAIRTRLPVCIADTESSEAPAELRDVGRARGFRSMVSVPMIREGVAIGAINVTRQDPGPFTGHQVNLLKTFADQAVIAIENVRLFKELQQRTEALTKSVGQLTALGEVGRAISSTLDLETVLKTIVQRAVQLTGLDAGSIYEYDEQTEEFRLQAAENMDPELLEAVRRTPVRKGQGAIGRSAVSLEPVQVSDIFDESYRSPRKELVVRAGYRAILAVPLLREDHLLGVILVNRGTPGPFAPEVVDLLKTFATQSALAIQNARLFREIAEKSRQLEVASRHKSQFLASMSHELRTPLNALLGFNEMILGDVYGEVPGDMKPPLAQMQASGKHLLRLINNVLDLAKIEAGRMELALSDYSVHDTVESVRAALRPLAADKGLELLAAVPADIPLAYGDAGRITQCLMNLAGNSLKFTKAGKVQISVALDDKRLRYSVADTGIGIPAEKIDSLFTEFKQTDATIASEYGGTGLGLSITKKFVEMHGGRIWVESEPGRGSTFSFEIPLRAREARAA